MAHTCAHETFAQKLHQFRGTLTSSEQQVLDAMVVTACRAAADEDVAGYGWPVPLVPVWQPFTSAVAQRFGLGASASSSSFECTWQGCVDLP